MAKRRLVLGTAGHIDHGKTQLVKALTGINTARQKEELQRGITIDLGFAATNLGDFEVGFVDVPGHERFVKNMLAGTTGVQFILLVVAADESIMPQTREHFHICRLLGIPKGMVVITKKNSVDSDLLRLVEEAVQDLIAGSFLNSSPIVAVDSVSGDGIASLREVLIRQLSSIEEHPTQSRNEFFRLPIDRIFSLRGFGTIVTGTPCGGKIETEDKVQAYPGRNERASPLETVKSMPSNTLEPSRSSALHGPTGASSGSKNQNPYVPSSRASCGSVSVVACRESPASHRIPSLEPSAILEYVTERLTFSPG